MSDLLEKLVLGEVAGKNSAIHAYDSIIWKVRTGFLTLLFIGWAVLLKSIVEDPEGSVGRLGVVCVSMLLFSLFLAIGGWLIDRNYMHRKFRVILALNALTDAIKKSSGNLEAE